MLLVLFVRALWMRPSCSLLSYRRAHHHVTLEEPFMAAHQRLSSLCCTSEGFLNVPEQRSCSSGCPALGILHSCGSPSWHLCRGALLCGCLMLLKPINMLPLTSPVQCCPSLLGVLCHAQGALPCSSQVFCGSFITQIPLSQIFTLSNSRAFHHTVLSSPFLCSS